MTGFILINKKEGPTSFDIIRKVRKALQTKKVGHAGTLDPLATGLLVVAIGKATKLLPLIPVDSKEYHFTIQFGETRTTADREGDVVDTNFPIPTKEEIEAVLPQFRGSISQTPPIYSAIKINGKKAYELARNGDDVKIEPREVSIHSLELVNFDKEHGTADFIVNCSSGTYVRSLSEDIAKAVESGGYAKRIHRTRVGDFFISSAIDIDGVTTDSLISPQDLFPHWGRIVVFGKNEKLILNGNRFKTEFEDTERVWVVNEDNELIALAKVENSTVISLRNFQ